VLLGDNPGEGGGGKRTFGPEKKQLSGIRQQKALPLPKRGSPAQALIEIILWLRLGGVIGDRPCFYATLMAFGDRDWNQDAQTPKAQACGNSVHLIQRGNNRGACFFADDDYQFC
jgi:hypothetical protein